MRDVDKITDKLGKPIDEGIKEAVHVLMLHGFNTSGSCEGHIKHIPCFFPWVSIVVCPPQGWKESDDKKKTWTIQNLKQQLKMIELLGNFYEDRIPSFWGVILVPKSQGVFGAFRLQSLDVKTLVLATKEEQNQKFLLYKKEMNDFINFLKNK